ncbi:MAG: hypothetical protein N3F63_00795 [Thermoplasmata archaeon]|nr:hypothetical protein [Thermoplasmata archaeon]
MGYSVAVASAILFTSLLLCFSFIYMGINFSIDAVERGFTENLSLRDAKLHTQVVVYAANLSIPESEIMLLNEGSTEIRTSTINILVNGVIVTQNLTISVDGKPTEFWYPGEYLKIQMSNLTAMPGKIKIVTGNGCYALI